MFVSSVRGGDSGPSGSLPVLACEKHLAENRDPRLHGRRHPLNHPAIRFHTSEENLVPAPIPFAERFAFFSHGGTVSVVDRTNRQHYVREQRRVRPVELASGLQPARWVYERTLAPVTRPDEIQALVQQHHTFLKSLCADSSERREAGKEEGAGDVRAVLSDDPSAASRAAHRGSTAADDQVEVFRCLHGGVRVELLMDPGAQEPEPSFPRLFCAPGLLLRASGAPVTLAGFDPLAGGRRARVLAAYRAWQAAARASHARDEADRVTREDHERRIWRFERARDAAGAAFARVRAPLRHASDYAITANDVELAVSWMEDKKRELVEARLERDPGLLTGDGPVDWHQPLREVIDTAAYDLERTLSARIAEKMVKDLLEAEDPLLERHPAGDEPGRPSRHALTDMAVRQVTREPGYDSRYDIAYPDGLVDPATGEVVPTRFLDVKNARGDGTRVYREFLVQKGREAAPATPIIFAGTYSEAMEFAVPLTGPLDGGERIQYLGEVPAAAVADIVKAYQLTDGSPLRVMLTDPRHPDRLSLPPWMFDLPRHFCRGLDTALGELRDAAAALPDGTEPRLPLALRIAAGMLPAESPVLADDGWKEGFLRRLRPGGAALRSLPHLYLGVLDHFFATLQRPPEQRENYRPGWYREVLFACSPDDTSPDALPGARNAEWVPGFHLPRTCPIGIPDPLQLVDALIGTLERMAAHGLEPLAAFTELEFRAAGELYGRHGVTGEWWTLLFPYCGAKKKDRVHASHTLEYGSNPHCSNCMRLICMYPGCCFCSGPDEKRGVTGCSENRLTLTQRQTRNTLVWHRLATTDLPEGQDRTRIH